MSSTVSATWLQCFILVVQFDILSLQRWFCGNLVSLSLGLLLLLHSRVCAVRLLDTCNKPCGECAVLYCSLLYMGIVQMTIVTQKLINKATHWCSWAREQKTWRKCCNKQLVLSVYANQEPLEKNIWCDAEKSLWEKGQQEERRRQEKNREKERQSGGDERQDEEEQKERGTECLEDWLVGTQYLWMFISPLVLREAHIFHLGIAGH